MVVMDAEWPCSRFSCREVKVARGDWLQPAFLFGSARLQTHSEQKPCEDRRNWCWRRRGREGDEQQSVR